MTGEGEAAPGFELPGVGNGEIMQVTLAEFLGEDVLILAFYPGDFNPACDGATTGLDDLDLFTMQKDVAVLAVSGDSVFSHQAFADEYDLQIPLLADVEGEVAEMYDVVADSDRYKTRRAVFVIDHEGSVEYRWVTDEPKESPDSDEIRNAIQNVGDDETAQARYRVAHAHYIEGRRAFTSAMKAYEDREWMLANQDFTQATDEFDEARDEFNSAVRFADDETNGTYYERAERKSESLWRAAEWMSESANAFASGEGLQAEELRDDAEGPLETAKDIHEPVDPDEFPPDTDPAADEDLVLPSDDEDTALELEETSDEVEMEEPTSSTDDGIDETATDDQLTGTTADDAGMVADGMTSEASGDEAGADPDGDDEGEDIDDAELEAITAELEEQNETADDPDEDDSMSLTDEDDSMSLQDDDNSMGLQDDDADDDPEDDDIELELTDPNEGETEDSDEEEDTDEEEEDPLSEDIDSSGDHGVPDSL